MSLRQHNIAKLKTDTFDVLIVGGGINGAVAAAALSAKGVKVALIDKGDFAGLTSSNSSNLAWGGIKYLESHEYLLVNKLCKSRNLLMRSYPSTVKEIRFLTCVQKGFRFPPLFIYFGALVYWVIGRFFTLAPKYLRPKDIEKREPIINTSFASGGLEYSDAYLFDNDARFVFNFIHSAMDNGCVAANYITALGAQYRRSDGDGWEAQVQDEESGEPFTVRSKIIVNACGPYVDTFNTLNSIKTNTHHLFSKGIHLIVDRIAENKRVLAFFASDGRLFFVIPMGRKTCVGTTDTPTKNPLEKITDEDRDFVLDNVNRLLDLPAPLTKGDVIAERCGVRPLAIKGDSENDDWLQLSRKHEIECDVEKRYLSIFGGKLTDCINVGEEVADLVGEMGVELMSASCWYGEPSKEERDQFFVRAQKMGLDALTWEHAAEPLSERYWRRYGEKAFLMLDAIEKDSTQAELLIENAEYTRCEIEYTKQHEMIACLEDFLRRRSKISLVLRKDEILSSPGLQEVCEIFFGDDAEKKLREYIESY